MVDKLDKGALNALQRCFADYDCIPLPRPVERVSVRVRSMYKARESVCQHRAICCFVCVGVFVRLVMC